MSATTVYQYFAASGALIYVGITDRGVRRLHEHADSKPWWEIATGCTLEHFETREQALAREEQLIRRYCPPYNYQHNPERALPLKERVARRLPNVRIPNACQDCFERPPLGGSRRRCLVCQQQWDAEKEARVLAAEAAARERRERKAAQPERHRGETLTGLAVRALQGRMGRARSLDDLDPEILARGMDGRVLAVVSELLTAARAEGASVATFRQMVNGASDQLTTIPISA